MGFETSVSAIVKDILSLDAGTLIFAAVTVAALFYIKDKIEKKKR